MRILIYDAPIYVRYRVIFVRLSRFRLKFQGHPRTRQRREGTNALPSSRSGLAQDLVVHAKVFQVTPADVGLLVKLVTLPSVVAITGREYNGIQYAF